MNKNISKWEKFRKILKLSFSLILIFTVLILLLKFLPIKNLNSFMNRQNSTRFYDSKGNLIYVLSLEEGLRREYYPIEEIPEQIQRIQRKSVFEGNKTKFFSKKNCKRSFNNYNAACPVNFSAQQKSDSFHKNRRNIYRIPT